MAAAGDGVGASDPVAAAGIMVGTAPASASASADDPVVVAEQDPELCAASARIKVRAHARATWPFGVCCGCVKCLCARVHTFLHSHDHLAHVYVYPCAEFWGGCPWLPAVMQQGTKGMSLCPHQHRTTTTVRFAL